MDTIVVSEKGQISIPADMRKMLGIEKGDRLTIVLKDGKMLMMPARRVWNENLQGEFDYLLKLSEGSAGEMWDNATDDRIWNNV